MSDIDDRLDRLESLVEQQQATIEQQQETIGEQRERIAELEADDEGDVIMNRRTALQAGGILGLLGVGAGAASADAQGSVGTSSDPLNTLYAEELNGGVTNDQSLTDLEGSGLSISSGTLNASGDSAWADGDADDLLEPSDGTKVGIGVDKIADNGSGNVTMGNSLDLDGNDVSISDSFNFHINTGSWPYVAFTDTNSQSEVRIDWDQDFVELHRTDLRIRDSGVVEDDTGSTHLTINSGGPLGVNQALDLNSNRISNAKEIHSDNNYITLKGSADLNLDGTELTERSGSMSITSVNGVSVDLDTDDTSADGNSDFSVTKHGGATALFTVNDGGDVDVHNGDLDLNSNTLTDSSGDLTIQSAPDNALVFNTNGGDRTMRLGVPDTDNLGNGYEGGGNVVAGHPNNTVADEAQGVVIGGGGNTNVDSANVVTDDYGTIGGGVANQVGDDDGDAASALYATVGGGVENTASNWEATVSGGTKNTASGEEATVGGGSQNTANNSAATVSGGQQNTASGEEATVAGGNGNSASGFKTTVGGGYNNTASTQGATVPGGYLGAAEDANSFVWNDSTSYHSIPNSDSDGLSSSTAVADDSSDPTGANTFSVSATGGVRFITGSNKVTYISGGTTGWSTASTRTAKTNIDPVDPERILDGVTEMEVSTWEYEDNDGEGQGVTHVGPMAEDFHEILDVGTSDEHINSINADGMAFGAIQGLAQRLDEKGDRIDDLETDLDAKDARIADQHDRIDDLREENERLRERNAELESRLDRIEAELGIDATTDQQGVADD